METVSLTFFQFASLFRQVLSTLFDVTELKEETYFTFAEKVLLS